MLIAFLEAKLLHKWGLSSGNKKDIIRNGNPYPNIRQFVLIQKESESQNNFSWFHLHWSCYFVICWMTHPSDYLIFFRQHLFRVKNMADINPQKVLYCIFTILNLFLLTFKNIARIRNPQLNKPQFPQRIRRLILLFLADLHKKKILQLPYK